VTVEVVTDAFGEKAGGGVERSRRVIGNSWFWGVKIAVATGIAYFLAGRVGSILRVDPGLAIFWPAAGVSVGALIALGRSARLPVAVAVFIASTACALTTGRNGWLSISLGFFNTGQALLTAWLLEQWFGRRFKLEDVRCVLWFFTATAIGCAVAATGAVVVFSLVKSTVPPLHVWGLWFAASTLGVVTVAPLLIGLGDAMRERLPRHELMEGWAGLISLTALTGFLISLPDGPWATALPEAMVFPFLLWVAIRCRPVFAAGAALVVGLTVIGSTALNVGNFDSAKPLADRIFAAQTFVFIESILVVLLAAVFAERRRSEQRLQLALDGAALGAFSADLANGQLTCDARLAEFHGHSVPPTTITELRRFIHPEDLKRIDGAVAEAQHSRGNWKAEYRVVPPLGRPHAEETRWVVLEGSMVRDARGAPVQLFGVTRDITLSKRGEQALAERNTQLALAVKVGRIGSFAFDIATGKMQVSAGYVAIHGLPEGTHESTRAEWRSRVHADDLPRLLNNLRQDIAERRSDHYCEYRIVLSDAKIRWIEARSLITYDACGCAHRVVGANVDVTERKRAQEHQRVLHAELDHRVKNVLATVSTVAARTMDASTSMHHFVASLDGRIRSMARTHELLSAARWQGISVLELVRRELAPYATKGNTDINGPAVMLKAEAGQAMGMVLHELATNAAKYGALSAQNGRVSIRWEHRLNGHPRSHLALEWREVGGPSVVAPENSGFGTSTIRDLIPYEFGGTVDLAFAPSGVGCRLELPANWLTYSNEVPAADGLLPT
jgi:two-component sensor histidine kinase/integral membrane sensor domain MASE1